MSLSHFREHDPKSCGDIRQVRATVSTYASLADSDPGSSIPMAANTLR